jgi:type II secretory pathway pseudopilin PulG
MARSSAAGFSLVDVMIVAGLVAVLTAMSAPVISAGMERYALISASQQVANTVRAARLQSVAKNRTLRVRFNCPAAGQYRIVEVVGDPVIDNAANRCDENVYPFPATDTDPATLPNLDGAVQRLPFGATFAGLDDLEINTLGRVTPLGGCPACMGLAGTAPGAIGVSNGHAEQDRTITVSRSGRVNVS